MTHDPTPSTSAATGVAGNAPPRQYISPAAIDLLKQTRPWVLLIAILTFISAGMLVLGGVGAFGVGAVSAVLAPEASEFGFPFALIGLVYLPIAALYFVAGRFLYRYAKSIQELSKQPSTTALEDALSHQKSFWKLAGVSIIACLGLYGVIIFVAVIVSLVAAVAI